MVIIKRLALLLSVMLASCAGASYTRSEKAAELVTQPLLTTSGGFLFYTGDFGGMFDPRGPLSLYLYGNGSEKNTGTTSFDLCAPPSLQEYQADPAPWQKKRRECPETYMHAVPMGTAIQIDDIYWSHDFENGDRYKITAHFVDPRLGRDEFEISQYYFTIAQQSPDGHMHLKQQYFKAQQP